VLGIRNIPPAYTQCVSVDFSGGVCIPVTGVFWLFTNIPILVIVCLVSDEFDGKLKPLAIGRVGGCKVISSSVFKARGWGVEEGFSGDVGGEVVGTAAMDASGFAGFKVEGYGCQGDGFGSLTCVTLQAGHKVV
jgi:hypothetical protein